MEVNNYEKNIFAITHSKGVQQNGKKHPPGTPFI